MNTGSKKIFSKNKLLTTICYRINNKTTYANSNGVNFSTRSGRYGFMSTMISKEGKVSSSMSGSGFVNRAIDKGLHQYSSIDQKLNYSQQQIHTKPVPEKFVGEIVIAPDCLGDFISFIISSISDMSMINQTSIYKDKLGEEITNPIFSLHSMPTSNQIQENYFFTNDGFKADDITIIEKGKLTKTVKNPNYRGISNPFWRSLKGVGNADTFCIYGTPNCDKGEPNQVIRVGHASPTCLFENIQIFGGV